jgi:cell division septation protein DedD
MPRKWSDWRFPVLIIGVALAAFLLGSAITIWLGTKPVASIAQAALLPSGAMSRVGSGQAASPGQVTSPGQASSPAASPPAAQATASKSASAAPPAAKAAAPAAQPAVPPPASAPGPVGAAAAPPGSYSLQLGAFLDAAKAKSLTDQLAAQGYATASIDALDGYGRTWHYIRFGAFRDESNAALAASDLLEKAGIASVVVRASPANAGG